jgi:hypothetical protein
LKSSSGSQRPGWQLGHRKAEALRIPCIHAAFEEPCDAYNAAFGQGKSTKKACFSTVFFGFYTKSTGF